MPVGVSDLIVNLECRAVEAESLLERLKGAVSQLQGSISSQKRGSEVVRLREENVQLRRQVDVWKGRLKAAEDAHGVKQIPLPTSTPTVNGVAGTPAPTAIRTKPAAPKPAAPKTPTETGPEQPKKAAKPKKEKKAEKGEKAKPAEDDTVDVGRLDFRIGRVISVEKHPDADTLFVETVDLGEEAPRTVVSGLVGNVTLEEFQNRVVVLLCNLKPVKMRGVTSQAMVMCASSPGKVEILTPPQGCQPGDRVSFEGFQSRPDTVLNPKKKIWETVAPDLKTGADRVANYRGVPFMVQGKGVVVAPTLANVQVK